MKDATPPQGEQNTQTEKTGNGAWPVRPLTRTRRDGKHYTREADVDAEIRALSALSERARKARLLETSETTGDRQQAQKDWLARVREETLVYFVREYTRQGDTETAWAIADLLTQRTDAHIARKLGRWRLTPDEAEDCAHDLAAVVFEALFSNDAAQEFWEVRFWVCLDRRLYNLLEKRQGVSDSEVSSADATDADGEPAEERLTRMADGAATPDVLAEYKEALTLLTKNERDALFLCYIEGLPEESEDKNKLSAAKVLNVTGRSVRNYLRRAKEKLRNWEQSAQSV